MKHVPHLATVMGALMVLPGVVKAEDSAPLSLAPCLETISREIADYETALMAAGWVAADTEADRTRVAIDTAVPMILAINLTPQPPDQERQARLIDSLTNPAEAVTAHILSEFGLFHQAEASAAVFASDDYVQCIIAAPKLDEVAALPDEGSVGSGLTPAPALRLWNLPAPEMPGTLDVSVTAMELNLPYPTGAALPAVMVLETTYRFE